MAPVFPSGRTSLSGFSNGSQKGFLRERGLKAATVTRVEDWENSPGVLPVGFPGKCDCFIYQMKTHSQDLLKVTMWELVKSGIEHESVCLFYPTRDSAL